MKEEFGDVFKKEGCIEGKLHLEMDKIAIPVTNPRRDPIALKDKLKSEPDRLVGLQMIRKVEGPTEWVSSLVVVEKPNGKLRVCIDPVHLNQALKRSHYPLPVIEDVLPDLADVKVFSKADLKGWFPACWARRWVKFADNILDAMQFLNIAKVST